jgi:hypothetical protein
VFSKYWGVGAGGAQCLLDVSGLESDLAIHDGGNLLNLLVRIVVSWIMTSFSLTDGYQYFEEGAVTGFSP